MGSPRKTKKKGLINPQGSGFGRKKKDAPESGKSNSYAHILYALSEGPIEGPIGWLKGIYLAETPVENKEFVDGNDPLGVAAIGGAVVEATVADRLAE